MQDILEKIYDKIKQFYGQGEVASYIPELAKINPNQFAMSVVTTQGREFHIGNFEQNFSIQSISKVFVLTMAMRYLENELWSRVGKEPSGSAFNSLVQLESENGIPRNPFINAGALVTTDVILSLGKDALKEIRDFVCSLSQNNSINYDLDVANSEYETSNRNYALSYFMKSFNNIKSHPNDLLDIYCHHCSLAMNTQDLARSFLFLANDGLNPLNNERVVSKLETKRINSLMMTCGLYDNVGDFAYKVGLPGKYAVSVWSPALNKSGNSLIGTKALELFTTLTEDNVF